MSRRLGIIFPATLDLQSNLFERQQVGLQPLYAIKEHGKVRKDKRIRFLYGCGEMAVEVILAQIGVDEEQQAVGLAVCAACLKQG